jgi:CBS domain-containing protein
MKASEMMTTHPTCCIPSDTAQTAAIIMRDEDTGFVPIVETKGSRKLAGVVTDRDLCIGVIAHRPQNVSAGMDSTNAPIEQFMTTKIVTCNPDDDLSAVLDLMKDNQGAARPDRRSQRRNTGRRFARRSDDARGGRKGRDARDAQRYFNTYGSS